MRIRCDRSNCVFVPADWQTDVPEGQRSGWDCSAFPPTISFLRIDYILLLVDAADLLLEVGEDLVALHLEGRCQVVVVDCEVSRENIELPD